MLATSAEKRVVSRVGGRPSQPARRGREKGKGRAGILFVRFVCLVITLGTQPIGCQQASSDRPNIILVTLDTTRADHFSSYGYPRDTTPRMDRIAGEGVRFVRAQAQSATTPVSLASLLSGRYPYRHGLRTLHGHRNNRISGDTPLLQETLRAAGYATAAFVSAYPASSDFGLARGYDHFDEAFLESREPKIEPSGLVRTGRSQRTAAETNALALAWLREHADAPFFVWIHYFDPHDARFTPPQEFVSKWVQARPRQGKTYLRELYDAELAYVDQNIGQLADQLKGMGRWDDTLMVITADHGEGLGDHDWWGHGILYQEQLRVPLIVRGPGIDRGSVVDRLVQHVDIAPTLLDIAGQGAPDELSDGRSILPLMRGAAAAEETRSTYAEVHNARAFSKNARALTQGEMYSVRHGAMKLIHIPLDPVQDQLYDLARDPGEQHNIIGERPDVVAALRADLKARNAIDRHIPDPSALPDDVRARLEALGYLEQEQEQEQ
jgi:arylsulfatase A-like enzyme